MHVREGRHYNSGIPTFLEKCIVSFDISLDVLYSDNSYVSHRAARDYGHQGPHVDGEELHGKRF